METLSVSWPAPIVKNCLSCIWSQAVVEVKRSPENWIPCDRQLSSRLGAIPAQYLMIYKRLWTPQDPSDRLSYDDLLTGYPGLVHL